MTDPLISQVAFAVRDSSRPLLVLGPSLGTSVTSLWENVVEILSPTMDIIGWDPPGHGTSPAADQPHPAGHVTIPRIAAEVAQMAARVQDERGASRQPYWYAGDSVGGAVGMQLALDQPEALAGAVLLCTAASFGPSHGWNERADLVEKSGTPTQIEGAALRWFAPGFIEAHGEIASRLLGALQTTDRFGYAAMCRAIADFDATDQLDQITTPVVAVAGDKDGATPIDGLAAIAAGVRHGRLAVLGGVAHQAPAEAPARVAEIIRELVQSKDAAPGTRSHRTAHAMSTRREVLGDAHVDRAVQATSAFTADFQDLITRYAWGEIWNRPGLERSMRSAVTITALVAGGHWEELPMHIRAALRNGLTPDHIKEILLQCAIYCSVPSANHAFAIADRVLIEAGYSSTVEGSNPDAV